MKKTYMSPTMKVVNIKRHSILCASPASPQSFNGRSVSVYSDEGEEISGEEAVW